ncbi:type I methionyl aminopeptidase [Candidatus Peregrinibacteria bacterium]|nr:type I methionyl aminopeptidase [Candidatus Peregrinibacteria bacterium]MBI3815950.1 type I methionyl aminopeptidase [Candidatus Peregrinibacteria bacterium]
MSQFQIFSARQIEALRKGGSILRGCLEEVARAVRPGVTTKELDRHAEEFIRDHPGAKPAFLGYNNYPATLCTSVNDACVHGLPGSRILRDGDIVALDCGVVFGGLYTDACVTVGVGILAEETRQFLAVSRNALDAACAIVKPGTKIGDISSTIQRMVEGSGYSCVRMLTGHGLGTDLHQFPDVPNVGRAGTGPILPAHTIIAIEPITSMGTDDIRELPDGWTIVTADGSLSAHVEHTVLVTEEGCEILA